MSFESESTLSAIGMEPVLEADPRFNQEQQNDARALPDRMRTLVLRFLSGRSQKAEEFPPFDYRAVADLLQGTDVEHAQGLITLIPEPLADDVRSDATRIALYLQQQLPRQVRRTLVKVTVEPPDPLEVGRFRRKWMVACDPLVLLRDLASGSVDGAMVRAFSAMWPEFYQALAREGGIVDEAIATMKARRGDKWDISTGDDRELRTLMGAPTLDVDLANDFARIAAADAAQPPPPAMSKPQSPGKPKDIKLDTDAEQLPGQRAS
jgi:hypothetical protein